MDLNKKEILNQVKKITEDLGYLFIEMNFRGDSRNHILEIYIDNENSVNVEDCAKVSRAIGEMIEIESLIESRYRLNVSSPGIDRPMKYIQQFKKNIGRSFELVLEDEKDKKYKGKLTSIEDDNLIFEIENKIKEINMSNIKSAKVIIRF